MEPFLSAHELSALMLISQDIRYAADLDRSEIEPLINRRLVERATGRPGGRELMITASGSAVLARICTFVTR